MEPSLFFVCTWAGVLKSEHYKPSVDSVNGGCNNSVKEFTTDCFVELLLPTWGFSFLSEIWDSLGLELWFFVLFLNGGVCTKVHSRSQDSSNVQCLWVCYILFICTVVLIFRGRNGSIVFWSLRCSFRDRRMKLPFGEVGRAFPFQIHQGG